MTTYFKDLSVGADSSKHLAVPQPCGGLYRGCGKRMLDIAFVLAAAPIVVPLIVICAILVARDGGSPFFLQRRIGRGGRTFSIVKLRTMIVSADEALAAHLSKNPHARQEWEKYQKLRDDPRITRLGTWLRTTSLDELPQLWNVLRGDMSLVGPRPMMQDQRNLYPGHAYFSMRPGITGPWQVSERNESTFAERAVYDDAYYRDLSLGTDLRLLARTVAVVLKCKGC